MKNQYNRARRHNSNNRSVRCQPQQIFRYTNLDSTGPMGKLRGTPLQLAEKYQAAAKDAQMQGDDVLMQTYQQYADHYWRLQNLALENEQALKSKEAESTAVETIQATEQNISPEPSQNTEMIDPSILPPAAE